MLCFMGTFLLHILFNTITFYSSLLNAPYFFWHYHRVGICGFVEKKAESCSLASFKLEIEIS